MQTVLQRAEKATENSVFLAWGATFGCHAVASPSFHSMM